LGLLLSLVSKPSKPIHIIAIGNESSHANIIMNKLGEVSQRFINIARNFDGVTVKKNDIAEAGPMSLAKNGVAYIGNWRRLPPKVVKMYVREVELGQMFADKLQRTFPLNALMWSHWSFPDTEKRDKDKIIFKTFQK
jgi:hypothetical protein